MAPIAQEDVAVPSEDEVHAGSEALPSGNVVLSSVQGLVLVGIVDCDIGEVAEE